MKDYRLSELKRICRKHYAQPEGCSKCPVCEECEEINNAPLNWDLGEESNYSEPEYTGNDWLNDKLN